MNKGINNKTKKNPLVIIAIVLLCIIVPIFIGKVVYNGIRNARPDNTNLIINNNNVTAKLKNNVIVENDTVYVSKEDVKNFFDKYIYIEQNTNQLITTYEKKIAVIKLDDSKKVTINGAETQIKTAIKHENDTIYLPMSELNDVYNIEVEYKENTNIVTMDSKDREQVKATASTKIGIKENTEFWGAKIDKVKKGDLLYYISDANNGWVKVRTQNGKVGYAKKNKLTDFDTVRENMKEEKQIEGKVNLAWDYFSEYHKAPNRNGTQIDGINVVSPAFFELNSKSQFTDNIGKQGEDYINWAHSNGYKVWPLIASNSSDGIDVRSNILNDFEKRQKLIDVIVDYCVKYKLDGVNIDFEYMYEKDKDAFSRFIIELDPRLNEIGAVLSVDVTAPDGAPTWSLCFDRNVIGDVADYIFFMAYDQNVGKKVGTGAGYNWVETSLKKFIETEEIKPEKIVLGFAFYSRLWTEKGDDVSSSIVNMSEIDKVLPGNVERKWNDTLKQDYVEYTEKNATKKMWIEDEKSIKEKMNLISSYQLGGVASWEIDRASKDVWGVINEGLNE